MIKKFDEFQNESVRDQMRPKSEEEINDAFDDIANDIADILIDKFDDEFDDWNDAYDWAEEHSGQFMEMIDVNAEYDLENIIEIILYGGEGDSESTDI